MTVAVSVGGDREETDVDVGGVDSAVVVAEDADTEVEGDGSVEDCPAACCGLVSMDPVVVVVVVVVDSAGRCSVRRSWGRLSVSPR